MTPPDPIDRGWIRRSFIGMHLRPEEFAAHAAEIGADPAALRRALSRAQWLADSRPCYRRCGGRTIALRGDDPAVGVCARCRTADKAQGLDEEHAAGAAEGGDSW